MGDGCRRRDCELEVYGQMCVFRCVYMDRLCCTGDICPYDCFEHNIGHAVCAFLLIACSSTSGLSLCF